MGARIFNDASTDRASLRTRSVISSRSEGMSMILDSGMMRSLASPDVGDSRDWTAAAGSSCRLLGCTEMPTATAFTDNDPRQTVNPGEGEKSLRLRTDNKRTKGHGMCTSYQDRSEVPLRPLRCVH
jgi:hypothetical protein